MLLACLQLLAADGTNKDLLNFPKPSPNTPKACGGTSICSIHAGNYKGDANRSCCYGINYFTIGGSVVENSISHISFLNKLCTNSH